MSSHARRIPDEKFVIRMPSGMRQQIALEARINSRSMNAEIVHRLETTSELEAALERAHRVIDQLLAVGQGAEQPGAGT
ncbi:Arc family DNA-binding protein [Pseudomonas sp.]|uniref:Arc family DNA-binding protein n=1 Tax=Pseudomonas sp. TaxID=306 RepID=UPI002610147C|nr:Arc family DNA-binding protein [Pseudomonas sp.]